MTDADAQLDAYEESDSIGPAILYPIIGSVFVVFCILSVAAFFLSNRKCCKRRKHTDVESVLLKKRLHSEQKRLSSYNFKFPFSGRPLFSSVMQQEDNTIAQEVKESYKTISTDVNKPIVCCPDKPISYVYNPVPPHGGQQPHDFNYVNKEATVKSKIDTNQQEKFIVEADIENARECDVDSLNGSESENKSTGNENNKPYYESLKQTYFVDSLEKAPLRDIPFNSYAKKHAKLFTESEVKGAADMKTLFFDRWIQNNDNTNPQDNESVRHDDIDEPDLSFDDVESILTSISRMDSCRMKKLKDSKFYKSLLSKMDTVNAGNTPVPNEKILYSPEVLDDIITSKLGNDNNQNLTHEELMLVVTTPVKHGQEKSLKDTDSKQHDSISDRRISKNLMKEKPHCQTNQGSNAVKEYKVDAGQLLQQLDNANSESLFRVIPSDEELNTKGNVQIQQSIGDLEESEISNSASFESSTEDKKYYDSCSESPNRSKQESSPTRPNSLNLKRKNTELKIEMSFDDTSMSKLHNTSENSSNRSSEEASSYTSSDSINASSSSKGSLVTSWQEIKELESKRRGPDENVRSVASSQHKSRSYSLSSNENSYIKLSNGSNFYKSPRLYRSPRSSKNYSKKRSSAKDSVRQSSPKRKTSLNKSLDSSFNHFSNSTDSVSKSPSKKLIPTGSLPKFVTGKRKVKQGKFNGYKRRSESSLSNTSY